MEGAMAEFAHHNPGVTPAIFQVEYPVGNNLFLKTPPSSYSKVLPGSEGFNTITTPSVRAPGTYNTLIIDR